jgi:hypothetical protein
MLYKTIILELLQQRPRLHSNLRKSRQLLPTLEHLAGRLKTRLEAWKIQLAQTQPGSSETQIASEALEIALKEMEDALPTESPSDESATHVLDTAMAYLRHHTPPA